MAIDKAVNALRHGELRAAGFELYDFARETVEKGFNAPKTRSWTTRGVQTADLLAHGALAFIHTTGPGGLILDAGLLLWGVLKFAAGKGSEMQFGKGGIASDVKAAGRKSMTFATIALVGATAYALSATVPVAMGVAVVAHGAAAAMSAVHLGQTFRSRPSAG